MTIRSDFGTLPHQWFLFGNAKGQKNMDAHHNEYLGAAAAFRESAGWHDTTNTQPTLAIGDFISGTTSGKQWSGHIEWFSDDASIVVNVGGAWVRVPAADVTF